MRRGLELRLRAIETEAYPATGEVWIQLSDGRLRGPRGETVTPTEFNLICAGLSYVVVLPDSGRDMQRP
jgi:hypothetical protein